MRETIQQHAKMLNVGDQPPALTIEKWAKGEAVKSFEKSTVYVIESGRRGASRA